MVRVTFVGQQDTSNHGARRLDDARALATSASGTLPESVMPW